MLRIAYQRSDRRAVISWTPEIDQSPWVDLLRRVIFDRIEEARQVNGFTVSAPWWSFVALRPYLAEIFGSYNLVLGQDIQVEDSARELLERSARNAIDYDQATRSSAIDASSLAARLSSRGFERNLTPEQLRNIRRLVSLPAGATFSVPGAGKTTEALALFTFRAEPGDKLLVVAPKNAFASWEEQYSLCFRGNGDRFVRLRGGYERIARMIEDQPHMMLITYQQLARVRELLASFVAEHRVHVYLDESHRIKGGIGGVAARALLGLSHLPVGKLIMSGTPMPQSIDDLVPQFMFLYPEISATADSVVELISPIYVRTTKAELGLPPVERNVIRLPMAPVQRELYRLMRLEVAREAATALSIRSRQAFRALGRSVARLLQFISNPSLLSSLIEVAEPDMLRAVLAEGDGPKLTYVLGRARQLAMTGEKVVIWSAFVRNVEYISQRLSDVGAVYIHGGVDAGDEDDDETREGKIRLFHDSQFVRVLVANPAAASEGVSLHTVCHRAIYLDRTFNAAHYLQSEDRIHRLGLAPDQHTHIEIVECIGSVDETVRSRLNSKVSAMATALNDPSLRVDPIPIDPPEIEDPEEYAVGITATDVEELLHDLTREGDA